jgi:hypothetical protein
MKGEKMNRMCWDINPDCMAKAEGDAKRPCPSFQQKISCWDLDWQPLLQKISVEQREAMGKLMKERCPKCPVYSIHRKEIDQKMNSFFLNAT